MKNVANGLRENGEKDGNTRMQLFLAKNFKGAQFKIGRKQRIALLLSKY